MFVDSHAHLDMVQFDSDRNEVIQRACDAGVELILTIGTGNPETTSVESTLELANNNEFIYAGLGVHPHDARFADESYWKRVEQWILHPKVVLWGEIGLDYHYDYSPREIQQGVFRLQMQMARKRALPISIHCREAWDDMLVILEQEWAGGNRRGILHSFTGTLDQARRCVAMGFLVSFSGIISFKTAESLREAAQGLELDQVLVETDCPYLAPVPHRGKRNEPAYVVDVARSLAETMGTGLEALARATTQNFRRLLTL